MQGDDVETREQKSTTQGFCFRIEKQKITEVEVSLRKTRVKRSSGLDPAVSDEGQAKTVDVTEHNVRNELINREEETAAMATVHR